MFRFVKDAATSAWAHFSSWWFYPLVLALYVPLVVLLILGIGGDATLALFRLLVGAALMGWVYDTTWRKRKAPRR